MFAYKRYVIADNERGLYFVDKRLKRVLTPGAYRIWDPRGRKGVEVYDVSDPEFTRASGEVLAKTNADVVAGQLELVELTDTQVGLVYYDKVFAEVLPPATRRVYWQGPVDVRVSVIDVGEDYALPKDLARTLARPRGGAVPRGIASFVYSAEVADAYIGMLLVDGEVVRSLKPGFYAYWKFNRSIAVEQLDTRVQPMEVNGQEILTRDKVSLRVNLAAQFQVSDALKARAELKNPVDWMYRELQFALRQAVGVRTLDTILGNKDEVDRVVFEAVAENALAYGMKLTSVGIKDVILPGEMKDILNQVVEAEKVAQANVIRRREETAATRSLLNTAKLMDDNPTLLRLKELETLEKVTDKVDKLTVFGGLEGVLKDTVRINA